MREKIDFMSSLAEFVEKADFDSACLSLKYGVPDWSAELPENEGWLSFATRYGATREFLDLMLASGISPFEPGVLSVAAKSDMYGIADWLIKQGVPLTDENWLAPFEAIRAGNEKMLELFLSEGALFSPRPSWVRETLLSEAVKHGSSKMVSMILNAGADVNEPTLDGITPLEIALSHRKFDVAEMLLDAGSDVSPSTARAEQWGQMSSADDEERSWMESSRKGFPWVLLVIEQSFPEKYRISKLLMRNRAQATGASPGGKTVLHELVKDKAWLDSMSSVLDSGDYEKVREDRLSLLRLALACGASPDAEDCMGWTPLLLAVSMDDREAFEVLLPKSNGHVTSVGSPLGLAVALNRIVMLSRMLRFGFSALVPDRSGMLPLDVAREIGAVALEKMICEYEPSLLGVDCR